MGPKWTIELTATAAAQITDIADQRVQQQLLKRIRELELEPEKQGKPLVGELMRYRSVRAVGQRYRVIYSLTPEVVTVYVVAVGMRKEGDRKDIYELAKKLMRTGLLEP